jgi:hypothetical protein
MPSVRAGVGPRWTEHTRQVHRDMDPVHVFIRWKIIHYSDYSKNLQTGPWTFVNQPTVQILPIFHSDPSGFPKLTRGPQFLQLGLKFEKYLQKGP